MENYIETASITTATALKAVSAAIKEGKDRGVAVSVAIVDPSLGLVAFAKSDGATPHSIETSRRKANAAASTRKSTGWMPDTLAITLPLGTGNLITNIPGGFPLKFESKVVGGLGIAGGTVEQDAAIAAATIAAVGAESE